MGFKKKMAEFPDDTTVIINGISNFLQDALNTLGYLELCLD